MSLRISPIISSVCSLDPCLLLGLLFHCLMLIRLITLLVINATVELGKELLHCRSRLLLFCSALSISALRSQVGIILSRGFLLIQPFWSEKILLCRWWRIDTKSSEGSLSLFTSICLYTLLVIIPLKQFFILSLWLISLCCSLIMTELVIEIWVICARRGDGRVSIPNYCLNMIYNLLRLSTQFNQIWGVIRVK